jgi:CRP/FNR family cyclic AMP-dependent transcriptional regulator
MTRNDGEEEKEVTNLSAASSLGRLIQHYELGDVLFREGDEGKEMFVVLKGAVRIVKASDDVLVELATFQQGDFFGEIALVDKGIRTGTAVVHENGTELMAVNDARFVYLVSQQPAFALSVIRVMGRRLTEMNSRLLAQTSKA